MVRRIVDVDLSPARCHGKQSAIARVLHVRYPSLGVADLSKRRTSTFGLTIYVVRGEKARRGKIGSLEGTRPLPVFGRGGRISKVRYISSERGLNRCSLKSPYLATRGYTPLSSAVRKRCDVRCCPSRYNRRVRHGWDI